jgi:hypothetical protein
MGVAAMWHLTLLTMVPAESSRRLVLDIQSGALEMILCTPFGVKEIVRGQWLSLGRRYLPPLIAVMLLSLALMMTGYVTYGFGGMIDPEDRGLWLLAWLAGILVLPLWLTTLCWVAMRRTLFARNLGEASAGAVVQVMAVPGFALWAMYALAQWASWRAGWNLDASWIAIPFAGAFVALLVAFAWRARRILLANLRHAVTSRYCAEKVEDAE